jgi:hypothetical protein
MKVFSFIFLPFVSVLAACSLTHSGRADNSSPADYLPTPVPIIEKVGDKCEEWRLMYELLTESQKEVLRIQNIVHTSDARISYYLISRELVGDCGLRLEIGEFLWKVQLGTDTKDDKDFAAKHSLEIVNVLRRVWDAPEFSSDGSHHEKYNLLNYEGIKDEDNVLLLRDLISKKVINYALLVAILEKPHPMLEPVITDSLRVAKNKNNFDQQICYLVILAKLTKRKAYFTELEGIRRNLVEQKTKIALERIIAKLRSEQQLESHDLEKLPIIDAEENK